MKTIGKIELSPSVAIRHWRTDEDDKFFTVDTPEESKSFPEADAWLMLCYARRMVEWTQEEIKP